MDQEYWEEKLALYDQLVSMIPEIERKGKTVPYTSANGHMFSTLNKDGELGIRLSKEDGEAFMEKFKSTKFTSYGAVMRGYVLIPDSLFEDMDLLATFLRKSHAYILSLPPKPTTKKK